MKQGLEQRVTTHSQVLRKMDRTLGNIEQRLAFLEVKVDHLNDHTSRGNNTRNIIAILVAAKVLFEGFGSIDWNGVTHLLKLVGG